MKIAAREISLPITLAPWYASAVQSATFMSLFSNGFPNSLTCSSSLIMRKIKESFIYSGFPLIYLKHLKHIRKTFLFDYLSVTSCELHSTLILKYAPLQLMMSFCMSHDENSALRNPCSILSFKIVSNLANVFTIAKKFPWWTFFILSQSSSDADFAWSLCPRNVNSCSTHNIAASIIIFRMGSFFGPDFLLELGFQKSLKNSTFSHALSWYSVPSCSLIFSELAKFWKTF